MDNLVERLLEERVLRLDKYTKTTMRRNPEGPEAAARITSPRSLACRGRGAGHCRGGGLVAERGG